MYIKVFEDILYIKLSDNSKKQNNFGFGLGYNNNNKVITNVIEVIDTNENILVNDN